MSIDKLSTTVGTTSEILPSGEMKITGLSSAHSEVYYRMQNTTSDVFYISASALTENHNIDIRTLNPGSEIIFFPKNGKYHTNSMVTTMTDSPEIRYLGSLETGTVTGQLLLKEPILINLTQSFGAGKEPSKEEMDRLMDYLGHFNGSKTISIGRFV